MVYGSCLKNNNFKLSILLSLFIFLLLGHQNSAWSEGEAASVDAYLSDFETFLPNTSVLKLPKYEKRLLKYYLDNPKNKRLAKLLGYLHLRYSLNHGHRSSMGKSVKHGVIAQYFFNRAIMLGDNSYWLSNIASVNQSRLDTFGADGSIPAADEEQPAHQYYRQAFHYEEKNRHKALNRLLKEYAREPNNVYTTFAITAVNLWIGGEADYDDPSMIYNFILGSYFSEITINHARHLEEVWLQDPALAQRFRMASILGGFSLLQRRWLASLHEDEAAISKIDDEHREWRMNNRAFHAFTLGIPFFEEPENFQEGKFAIEDGFAQCMEDPEVRTCLNRPRFYFNLIGFILTLIDFNIKEGDIATAQALLNYRFNPTEADNWANWDLGREAWLHREQNLHEIAALYQNDDVADDPIHFQIKPRKWGDNTTTCQTCHQTQSREWTEEEFNTLVFTSENVATIGTWPAFSTTWWAETNE